MELGLSTLFYQKENNKILSEKKQRTHKYAATNVYYKNICVLFLREDIFLLHALTVVGVVHSAVPAPA